MRLNIGIIEYEYRLVVCMDRIKLMANRAMTMRVRMTPVIMVWV